MNRLQRPQPLFTYGNPALPLLPSALLAMRRISSNLARPAQKPQKLPLFAPPKMKEVPSPQRLCFLAGISLQPPSQIRTPPRPQSAAARRIPQKSHSFKHVSQYIGRRITTSRTPLRAECLLHIAEQVRPAQRVHHAQQRLMLHLGRLQLRRNCSQVRRNQRPLLCGQLSLIRLHIRARLLQPAQ